MGWFDFVSPDQAWGLVQGGMNDLGFGPPPGTPDFRGAAEQTAQANRPNINGPFAGQQWTQGPDGQWTMNNGFSGPLAGAAQGWGQQAANAAGMGMPDVSGIRDQTIQAAYGQATSRLDPQWAQRQGSMDTQLANQGLDPTTEAAQVARQQFGQARNDAYGSAMNSAIGLGNAAANDAFNQQMQARQLPLAQIMAMQSLTQTPQFNQGPNYLGAEGMRGAYDMSRWNGQRQQGQDMMNQWNNDMQAGLSLFGTGARGGMF